MSIRIIGPGQYIKQQWKNGGGSTLELFRYPDNHADYQVRLSIAEVNSTGPFSVFSGYQRSICQLAGPPMHLTHPDTGTEKMLKPGEPYHFSGDRPTDCRITGPARDFNVIWKKAQVDCSVELIVGPLNRDIDFKNAEAVFLFVQKGSLKFLAKNEAVRLLESQHLMIVDGETQPIGIELTPEAALFVIHLWLK